MIVYKELSSIETDLGFSAKTLYSLSNKISKHYVRVCIPKRSGGLRTLYMPDDLLKMVQKKIAKVILAYEPVSKYATAYKIGASIQKNAKKHVGKEKILKLDIYRFFDNIKYWLVKDIVFPEERFSEQNRILLSVLCFYNDVLPQGAPTSPIITNIIMREFDETVGNWCKEKDINYTRYCDDMTFSGSFDEKEIIEFVSTELKKLGLLLNKRKTVVANNSQRQFVTGIIVNKKINTPLEYRKKLRQEVYYCRKFGVAEHLKRIGSDLSPQEYLNNLFARLNYALCTSPDNERLKQDKEYIHSINQNF